MARGPLSSAMVFLIRDRGHGRVTVDGAGNPVHTYPFDDALDLANFRHGLRTMAVMHEAAGAQAAWRFHGKPQRWVRSGGEPLEDYVKRMLDAPLSPFEHATFS